MVYKNSGDILPIFPVRADNGSIPDKSKYFGNENNLAGLYPGITRTVFFKTNRFYQNPIAMLPSQSLIFFFISDALYAIEIA